MQRPWHARVIHCIRPLLGFKRKGSPIDKRLAVLAALRALEEVAAVELKSRLVRQNLYVTSCLMVGYARSKFKAVGRLAVQTPVMVITLAVVKLAVQSLYHLPYRMAAAEIKRRTLNWQHLPSRN